MDTQDERKSSARSDSWRSGYEDLSKDTKLTGDAKLSADEPRRGEKETTHGDKPNREPKREALDEGARSDIEEWLDEDSKESDLRRS